MITPEYVRIMARYNAWQNNALWAIVEPMPLTELDADRGAFFGSIRATLNHLLWGDHLWLSRFDGGAAPTGGIEESVNITPTPAAWWAERFRLDGRMQLWAEKVSALDLVGELTWDSGALGREVHKPIGLCVMHFFNHQTHHRGQVHAMLTAAGYAPEVTDLFIMPED